MKKLRNNNAGFTMIELMIATLVFSVILLGATSATIQIGRMYYKGIVMSRTQDVARNTMDSIARPIQFAGGSVVSVPPTSGSGALCVGNQRFSYLLNAEVDDGAPQHGITADHKALHALWADTIGQGKTCAPLDLTVPSPADTNTDANALPGKELLGQGMRLAKFNPSSDPSNDHLWTIDFLLIYGDDDLLEPNATTPTACKSIAQSAQWCATSALSTTVFQRVN